jgi:hypothetical protein
MRASLNNLVVPQHFFFRFTYKIIAATTKLFKEARMFFVIHFYLPEVDIHTDRNFVVKHLQQVLHFDHEVAYYL